MKKPFKQHERVAALEYIKGSLATASTASAFSPSAAARLVRRARRIAMKKRIRIPPSLKRRFCKHCYSFLRPGVNCRVRLSKRRVIYLCLTCKHFMRFPYTINSKQ